MIRACVRRPDDPLVIAGLVEGNIVRLKNGHPIHATFKSFGVDLPGSLGIIYARNDEEMEKMMVAHGLIGPNTEKTYDPQQVKEELSRSMNQKILLCTMGLPRSGKSTWAKEQAFPVVNPDSIRLAMHGQRFYQQAEDLVWAHAKLMVRSLFIAGHHTVIVDATNGTKRRRAMWFDDDWVTYWKLFDTSREECIARAVKNSDPDIIPVIEQLATAWEPLDDKAMRW